MEIQEGAQKLQDLSDSNKKLKKILLTKDNKIDQLV